MKENEINLSEIFFSVQAEGVSSGVPAFFLRFFNCNLNCGIDNSVLQQIRKLVKDGKDSYSQEVIDLMVPQEGATWVCDSIPVWVKSNPITFHDIVKMWDNLDIKSNIFNGVIHLIWSGGEPLMKANQEKIVAFHKWFMGSVKDIYNEVETNGTQYIEHDTFKLINQINCSPKLKNSGHEKDKRVVPFAIQRIMEHKNYWFKFVISSEEDIAEILTDYIYPFSIPKDRIILMPALSTQKEFHDRSKFIMELSKKYFFRCCQRLHISAWDQVVGV